MEEGWIGEEDRKLENIPFREDSYFDKTSNRVFCKEPIPEMRLSENANPSKREIKNLCSCIWNKYPTDGYLTPKKLPTDPWGNPYIYVYPGEYGDFDIISLGADGAVGGEGENADIGSWTE